MKFVRSLRQEFPFVVFAVWLQKTSGPGNMGHALCLHMLFYRRLPYIVKRFPNLSQGRARAFDVSKNDQTKWLALAQNRKPF
jgi:hypothetical protein